jgi:cob(I)alamin adenosyltransferase
MRFSRLNPRLATLVVLLVAGCGGGGGSTSEPTQAKKPEAPARLSKADFIVQGDGICGEVNSAVGSIEASEAEVASSEQAAQIANLYTGMIERLLKLGTPSETEGYAEFSEAAEELGKVEGEVKAAAEKEESAVLEEAANEAVPALEGFQNAAAVYGFEDCSEGPQAPVASTGAGAGAEEPGIEEGGVEPEVEEEFIPEEEEVAPEEEEFVPEEEVAPETGGAGGVGEGEVEEGGGEEESAGGGIGPG